jgi:hypothetical protein
MQNYHFAYGSMWMRYLVSDIKGRNLELRKKKYILFINTLSTGAWTSALARTHPREIPLSKEFMCSMRACSQKWIWSWGRVYSQIQFLLLKHAGSQVTLDGRVINLKYFNCYLKQIKNIRTAKNGKYWGRGIWRIPRFNLNRSNNDTNLFLFHDAMVSILGQITCYSTF